MTQKRSKLTNAIIQAATPNYAANGTPYTRLIGDSNGLNFQISGGGVQSWIFRYTLNKKTRAMGLGPLRNLSLLEARKRARELKVMVDQGVDPLALRDQELAKRAAVEAASITFRQCAEIYLANMKAVHKNPKHHAQWHSTLEKYAFKVIGDMPVQDITVKEITKIIDPLWNRIPETASRLRGRIEKILGWCLVRGHRVGDNPARWAGYLSEVYPKRASIREVKHHNALPYQEMPDFLFNIRNDFSAGAELLRFIIFTMTRTGEARAARWSEFNLDEKIWIIPGHRMKAGKEHRIPLSPPAMSFLQGAKTINDGLTKPSEFVFPGRKAGTCVSDATAIEFLKRIDRTDVTPHGMRSCARVWGAECTEFPREILEASLAHKLRDRVEAAYQRSDYLIKRRDVMNAWANFCQGNRGPGASAEIGRNQPNSAGL